jgi:WXXGXW repeat (2 copies)
MRFFRISLLALPAALAGVSPAPAQIAVGVSITVPPPALPVYEQPVIPAPGYIWTPGYWAWGDDDYYWVPGTWVQPPAVGLLWTPGYWGWHDGIYGWNAGYWGPHVGFYGGINYGFGYSGVGYGGGVWRGGVFSYNRTVNNFGGVHITNVYSKTIINNTVNNHVSFNGGAGGTSAMPTAQERLAANEHHVEPTQAQTQHQQTASNNPELRSKNNNGHPSVGGTSHAGNFNEGVTHANNGGEPRRDEHAAHNGEGAGHGPSAGHGPGGGSGPGGGHGPGGGPGPGEHNAANHPGGNNAPKGPPGGGGPQQHGGNGGHAPGGPKVANNVRPPQPPRPAPHGPGGGGPKGQPHHH